MSSLRKQIDPAKIPKGRVELHLHLDGSIRTSTIWDLANRKGVKIGKTGSLEDVEQAVRVFCPQDLAYFLGKFATFIPLIGGDKIAIERVAYELCEDQAAQGVAYFEARYSPIFLANPKGYTASAQDKTSLSYQDVVDCITSGLKRGELDFGVKSNQILCLITNQTEHAEEVFNLIKANRQNGVVAIDIAGNESLTEIFKYTPEEASIFRAAKAEGIHRTAHAAEIGPASNVQEALEELCTERIGHGYHVVEDEALYEYCLQKRVHFECCPYSSILTGAVSSSLNHGKHPIVKFAEDGANFSINKDDTTVTGTTLDDEYALLTKLGLTEAHFVRANLNAARSAFLPEAEKDELYKSLLNTYGLNEL